MVDEPENLVLVQLREMRAEAAAFRTEVSARFDEISGRFGEAETRLDHFGGRFDNIERRLDITEAAQTEMLHILKDVAATVTVIGKAQQVTGSRLNSMD